MDKHIESNLRSPIDEYVVARRGYVARLRSTIATLAAEIGAAPRDCTFALEGFLRPPLFSEMDPEGLLERMRALEGFDDRVRPLQDLAARLAGLVEEHARRRSISLDQSRHDLHESYMTTAGMTDAMLDVTPAEHARINAIAHRYAWLAGLLKRIIDDVCQRIAESRGLSALDELTAHRIAALLADNPDPVLRDEVEHVAGVSCLSSCAELSTAHEDCIDDAADHLGVSYSVADDALVNYVWSMTTREVPAECSFIEWARPRYV